jgi:hypothetical protein
VSFAFDHVAEKHLRVAKTAWDRCTSTETEKHMSTGYLTRLFADFKEAKIRLKLAQDAEVASRRGQLELADRITDALKAHYALGGKKWVTVSISPTDSYVMYLDNLDHLQIFEGVDAANVLHEEASAPVTLPMRA